jgi:hypothetical protein
MTDAPAARAESATAPMRPDVGAAVNEAETCGGDGLAEGDGFRAEGG